MHIWLVQYPEKTNFFNQMQLLYTRSKCIPCYFMTVSIIATAGLRNQPINGVLSHNQIARNAYLVGSIPRKNKFLKPDVAIIHPFIKCIPCYFMTVSIIATAGLRNQPINGVLSHNQIARNAYLVGSIPRKNEFLKPDVAIIHPVKVHPMLLYDRVYNSYSWFKKSAHKRCIVTQPNRTECIFGWFNTPKKQIS